MVDVIDIEAAIENGDRQLFFRHTSSRKPYKVIPLVIVNRFKQYAVLTTPGANVRVAFSNGEEEIVSSHFLYKTWQEAEQVAPARAMKIKKSYFSERRE